MRSRPGSPFPLGNLPYGVFATVEDQQRPRIGVAIGDFVLDAAALAAAQRTSLRDALPVAALNPFMASGPAIWERLPRLPDRLAQRRAYRPLLEPLLTPLAEARLQLPFEVADYVDFYSSEHHATNLGRLLRPGQPPLHPNWRHLPVGYHGRSGTVRVSGTPVLRPRGQRLPGRGACPVRRRAGGWISRRKSGSWSVSDPSPDTRCRWRIPVPRLRRLPGQRLVGA